MGNIIAIIIIVAILGSAIGYIVHAKRNGAVCIGCSCGGSCGGHCGSSCGSNECSCEHESE